MVELELPDQGWAWAIAAAACIINMVLSGLSRMIGILYVSVIDVYNVSRQEATLPFAVRNSIRMLSGPLVGIIGQSYGIRTVTFCGGVVAAAGAALCCIAPNVTWLAIFWGGFHGMGFAFANTLFQVIVNQYFEKYRATASGIALSGACVGSLGFPIMIESILDSYGLSGGFLILGGVVMHVLPPALLLKSPPWVTNPTKYAKQLALYKSRESNEKTDSTASIIIEKEELNNVINPKRISRQRSLSNNPVEELVYNINSNHLEDANGIFSRLKGNESWETKEELQVVCTLYKIKPSPTPKRKQVSQIETIPEENTQSNGIPTISAQISENEESVPLPKAGKEKNENHQSLLQSIKSIATLYTNPVYILISVCMSTYVIIFIPILTVIVDYSIDKGISEVYGKYLINAMAIGDLAGRLGFGWVTDRGIMTIPAFMTLMLVLQGIFIALFPIVMSLYTFMTVLVLYGMAAGSMLVLFPVLVLKYVDMSVQSVAMACVGFLSGIVSFCIPPLIGHFRDTVGSYDGMFYLTGGISVVSGGMWLLEPVVVKFYFGENFEQGKKGKNSSQDVEENNRKISKPS